MQKELLEMFSKQKKMFLRQQKNDLPGDTRKILDRFEEWLRGGADGEAHQEWPQLAYGDFVDMVLAVVKEKLARQSININYDLPGQSLGISESWKCIKVFGNKDIYYRIGRTRPRKGPHAGQEILVFDLVMDGYKKQVFLPLLESKAEMEQILGQELERELPKVESTGKYRLKVVLPFSMVHRGEVEAAAARLAEFIAVTHQKLSRLGVH